ncbi:MAG: hypothetical protein KAT30_17740 [Candidatus Krumholzibacteria bacterium]|nr:hypothetical protein [Candidatus Krumholzibacteria bacterium]
MFAGRILGAIALAFLVTLIACTQDQEETEKAEQVVADNYELRNLYEQDQADRSVGGDINWRVVDERDSQRRERVLKLLDSGKVITSEDYRHAAMVFQHVADENAARLAHSLAQTAVRLDSTNARAKWLLAASWDRYQMRLEKPQWYGTQYVKDSQGLWQLYDIDTTAVSDEMRRQLGVPSLAESRARVQKYNRQKED